jgi:hypothetical protein
MANFTELYNDVANDTSGVPSDPFCDRARELIPPMARVWEVLAKLAIQSWDNEIQKVCYGELTANDYTDGNHAKLFILNLMTFSPDNIICDPRFQGMLLGLEAVFPYNPFCSDHPHITRKIVSSLFIEVDDEMIDWVSSDGFVNMEWDFVQHIASQWLRAWCSARKIQRTYRNYIEHKEIQRQKRLLITIPRIVSLLKDCKGRE